MLKNVPDDFDDLPEDEQQKILDHWKTWSPPSTPPRLREEILQLAKLDRPRPAAGTARERAAQAGPAPGGADPAGHLQGPRT